ncbi:MAG: hypothetical protein CME70_21140 [Halobacteriovorax sp.]|nr:hypothetical protein [Halobacteriovorax sp.]|tara:strand:- start:82605 stop:84290 length:1686 start_codon:yes stop_codon:yes gene_type:complete
MKGLFLITLFVFSLNSFGAENPYLLFRDIDQKLGSLDLSYQNKSLSKEQTLEMAFENYKEIKNLQLRLRNFSEELNVDVIDRINRGVAIIGQDLTIIHKSVKYFLHLNSRMLSLSSKFTPDEIDDLDEALITTDELESRENLLWFAIQLSVIDDYLLGYRNWMKNQKFRRIVNAEDSSYNIKRKELKKYIHSLLAKKHQKMLNKATEGFDNFPTWRSRHRNRNSQFAKFEAEVETISAKSFVGDKKAVKDLRKELRKAYRKDGFKNFWTFSLHHISGFVGNIAGAIKWRKGWLYKRPEVNKEIYAHLEPLDMITEKTPFILTDTLIPGHFGHNAIWLGTKEQLIAYGLWNHPRIKPVQHLIEQGKSIIESDRTDTHLKSIEDFMKVDEFAIMRNKKILTKNKKQIEKIYDVALSQLGKTYDFNFDVETTDKLVCSELLYQSFGHVAWPTEKYIGRTTISPDNVGELLLYGKTPNKLVYYVAAYERDDLVRKDLKDMGKDMGYRFNEERSTPEYPYFEKPVKNCRKIVRDEKIWRSCGTTWKHNIYNAPVEREFPDLGELGL